MKMLVGCVVGNVTSNKLFVLRVIWEQGKIDRIERIVQLLNVLSYLLQFMLTLVCIMFLMRIKYLVQNKTKYWLQENVLVSNITYAKAKY